MSKKIFISYSEEDKKKMRSMEKIIEKTGRFKPVIIADRRDALIALTDKVKNGIFECDYFVPIITKNSIYSQWVNQEIGYASAMNKIILPIVEGKIIVKLKGFIHKNIDLPYKFLDLQVDPKKGRNIYRKACNLLINDLLVKNNYAVKTLELENVFPGQWSSEYKGSKLSGKELDIEVKDGNKYLVRGYHLFNLEEFKVSSNKKRITFVKVGLGNDRRRIFNDLKVLKLGEVYSGVEREEVENLTINITYTRVK